MSECVEPGCQETEDIQEYLEPEKRGDVFIGVTKSYCAEHDPWAGIPFVPIGWDNQW